MPVAFTLKGKSEVGFSLGDHIPGILVIIGLTLVWNTFLGSNWYDEGLAIATDGTCVHGAGYSDATWQGTSPPVHNHSGSGNWDAFVAGISERQRLDVPWVTGKYSTSCSIKLYDWQCNKYEPITGGTLYITYQMRHKVRYCVPDVIPAGRPQLIPVKGYVGSFYRVDGAVKDTPGSLCSSKRMIAAAIPLIPLSPMC